MVLFDELLYEVKLSTEAAVFELPSASAAEIEAFARDLVEGAGGEFANAGEGSWEHSGLRLPNLYCFRAGSQWWSADVSLYDAGAVRAAGAAVGAGRVAVHFPAPWEESPARARLGYVQLRGQCSSYGETQRERTHAAWIAAQAGAGAAATGAAAAAAERASPASKLPEPDSEEVCRAGPRIA